MNPLTITWPPILYTDYGYENFKNWLEVGGFDNIFKPNPIVQKIDKTFYPKPSTPFSDFYIRSKKSCPKNSIQLWY